MSKVTLEKFIKTSKIKAEDEIVNWQKVKDKWLDRLNSLYKMIESWLAPFIEDGSVIVRYGTINISEENIGIYKARTMVLKVANEEAALTPVGTLIIGALGRVDLEGKYNIIKLLLARKNAKGISIKVKEFGQVEESIPNDKEISWKIATPPPSIKFIELTEDSFSDALLKVIND